MNILILGLGNHGGGAGAAEYFCKKGFNITVTDLRSEVDLQKSLIKLSQLPITYRLNSHNPEDIKKADLIIKNPAVSPDNRLLLNHTNIQSDLSYTLPLFNIPIIAITGTKGKSTTAASIAATLEYFGWKTFLMGNIGISPFQVLSTTAKLVQEDKNKAIIILELSSWQLRDLSRYTPKHTHPTYFSMAVITSLFRDHLNTYQSYKDYISDKMMIFTFLKQDGITVIPENIKHELAIRSIVLKNNSIFTTKIIIDQSGNQVDTTCIPKDLIPASAVCINRGYSLRDIKTALHTFTGLSHRREILRVIDDITYINDSASTVPEAISYCIENLNGKIHLISGGTDKKLETGTFMSAYNKVTSLHLLGGSLTERLIPLLSNTTINYTGPYRNMENAFTAAKECAEMNKENGCASYVILSPGAASFDIFLNEFERGNIFKELVFKL